MRRQAGAKSAFRALRHTHNITMNTATRFCLPRRFGDMNGGSLPFFSALSAATLFAGQNVAVTTGSVTNQAAAAVTIARAPQTVDCTIVGVSSTQGKGNMVYTITLDSTSWLATLTGATTVTVYTNGNLQEMNNSVLAPGDATRFNGFLFKINGNLALFAAIETDGAARAIGPN